MKYLIILALFLTACKKEKLSGGHEVQFVVTSATGLSYLRCQINSVVVGNYTTNPAKSGDKLQASYSRCCDHYFDASIYVDGVLVAQTLNDKYLNLRYTIK